VGAPGSAVLVGGAVAVERRCAAEMRVQSPGSLPAAPAASRPSRGGKGTAGAVAHPNSQILKYVTVIRYGDEISRALRWRQGA
jgi:hypothetical protein